MADRAAQERAAGVSVVAMLDRAAAPRAVPGRPAGSRHGCRGWTVNDTRVVRQGGALGIEGKEGLKVFTGLEGADAGRQ